MHDNLNSLMATLQKTKTIAIRLKDEQAKEAAKLFVFLQSERQSGSCLMRRQM